MSGVFQNSAMVLSMGIFFTLIISGVASVLPRSLYKGLVAQHVPAATAAAASHLPPITSLFSALLGYDPIKSILGPAALAGLPAHSAAVLSGRTFFPTLIATPFSDGLTLAFTFGAIACALAAAASMLRGKRYVHEDAHEARPVELPTPDEPRVPAGLVHTLDDPEPTASSLDGLDGLAGLDGLDGSVRAGSSQDR